jgi:hypothetical protein
MKYFLIAVVVFAFAGCQSSNKARVVDFPTVHTARIILWDDGTICKGLLSKGDYDSFVRSIQYRPFKPLK